MAPRVLLTTIPKAGKNLLVSFFSALGLERQSPESDLTAATLHVQELWFHRDRLQHDDGGPPQPHATGHEESFERILERWGALPAGSYVQAHLPYDEELLARVRAADLVPVFLYRDPRACLASLAHYLVERGEPATMLARLPSRDLGAVLRFLVAGDDVIPPFEQQYAQYRGWLDAPGVAAVRFEDLVGPRGGGTFARQAATLAALAERVGWAGSPWTLLEAIDRTFNPQAGTFRRGTIDGWRDDLAPLRGTDEAARIAALAQAWGYADDEQAEPSDADAGQRSLAALLERCLEAHRREEAARATAAAAAEGEHLATIARLERRIVELEASIPVRIGRNLTRAIRLVRAPQPAGRP